MNKKLRRANKKKKNRKAPAPRTQSNPAINQDFNAAVAHHGSGKIVEAEQLYRKILIAHPDHPQTLHNLGLLLLGKGNAQEAAELVGRAAKLNPSDTNNHMTLGNALYELGEHEEAMAAYGNALRLNPTLDGAHNNLGNALVTLGKISEAIESYRKAIHLKPDLVDAHNSLGNALNKQGQPGTAIASFHEAIRLNPGFAIAHYNLGISLKELGREDEAIDSYRNAIRLNPNHADAHGNLGNILQDRGLLDESITEFREVLRINPDYTEAHYNLGNSLKDQGRLDDSVASFRDAMKLDPRHAKAHNNLLLTEQYREGASADRLKELHAEFETLHGVPLRDEWRDFKNIADENKTLRVGFVSADLGTHPVGYFVIQLLENSPKSGFEFICYTDRAPDALTDRFKAATHSWVDIRNDSDEELASRIRSDGIDVLIDLSGHTGNNRLLVFARKPAPVQVTWLGYVGTTGLAAMDYLIADRWEIPEEHEHYYFEKIIRMPDGWLCYDPPDYAPPVSAPPSDENGFVTFGSFNNPVKINQRVLGCWVNILTAVPNSQLVLKYNGVDWPINRDRFLSRFEEAGIETSRIILEGRSQHADLLARYNDIDIALDTFPYAGGITTCEALWMGVPVITLAGDTFACRHSLSHLSNVGIPEFATFDEENYVALAIKTANEPDNRSELRTTLRTKVAQSGLCDGPKFAHHFATNLREIWHAWCEQK
jgi:protein O-GlcNAc transferase